MLPVPDLLPIWTGHLEELLYMLVQATCSWDGPVFCTAYKMFHDFMSIQKFIPHDRCSQKCHNFMSDSQKYGNPGYFEVKRVIWRKTRNVTAPWTRKASHKRSKDMFRISVMRCSTHQIFMHDVAGNKYRMRDYTEELHCFGKVIITRLIGKEPK